MKTNHLLLMAMTALLTAGCSQNEIMEVSPDAAPPVGFNVYATAQTRGTETDNNAGTTGIKNATGFGVLAYHTGQAIWNATGSFKPNFMWNQQVKWSSNVWSYTPVKYWPNTINDKISFFAYAPYSATQTANSESYGIALTTKSATTKPTITFKLQATPMAMVDLVTAFKKDIMKQTIAVNFDFKHILTRANFKAKVEQNLSNSPTYIFVTGMRILGTQTAGTGANASGANAASKFYNTATYDWSAGTWLTTPTPTQQTTAYEISSTGGILDKKLHASTGSGLNQIPSTYTTQGIKVSQDPTTSTPLFVDKQFLFLIPPADLTGIASEKDVRVQIDYDIVTVDSKLDGGCSKTSTSYTVSLPNGTLKRGAAYDFILTIGLEKVQISAAVSDWATATNTPVPSVTATVSNIATAIATLNTTKISNPNCNYFVINVTSGTVSTLSISTALTSATAFKSGDKIELNFAANPGISSVTLPTGNPLTWKADRTSLSAAGKIILTRI